MSKNINILELLFNDCSGSAEQVKERIVELTPDYNDMTQNISPNASLATRVRALAIKNDMQSSYVEGALQAGAVQGYPENPYDLVVLRSLAVRRGEIDSLNPAQDLGHCM